MLFYLVPLTNNLKSKLFPPATLLLIALNCLVYVLEVLTVSPGSLGRFVSEYTMVPANVTVSLASHDPHLIAAALFSILTAMFLHAGKMHLAGNMLYLYIFGRPLEARLGRCLFIVFYITSGLAASAAQILSEPWSTLPILGASGAIAGILGGYLCLWPKSKITALVAPPFLPIRAQSYLLLLLWFGMQILFIVMTGGHAAISGVAYFEHVGGFLAGLVMAFFAKRIWPIAGACVGDEQKQPIASAHDTEAPPQICRLNSDQPGVAACVTDKLT